MHKKVCTIHSFKIWTPFSYTFRENTCLTHRSPFGVGIDALHPEAMKKKDNKQAMLIRYPRTVMVNKENYYGEYKGHTKWLSLISSHFAKNVVLA